MLTIYSLEIRKRGP